MLLDPCRIVCRVIQHNVNDAIKAKLALGLLNDLPHTRELFLFAESRWLDEWRAIFVISIRQSRNCSSSFAFFRALCRARQINLSFGTTADVILKVVIRDVGLVSERVVREGLAIVLDRCEVHSVVTLVLDVGKDARPAFDWSEAPRDDCHQAQLFASNRLV